MRVTHTFRFYANATFTKSAISSFDLIPIAGALATTTTSVRPIASNMKIHSIEMWATPDTSADAIETIALEWTPFGTLGASNLEKSDTSISNARPAHIFTRPPRGSSAEFWFDDLVDVTLLLITGPKSTVIDVNVSYVLNDSSPTSAISCTAATVGRLYFQAMDGTTNNLLPISLQHIV